jgi:hypothetical protein
VKCSICERTITGAPETKEEVICGSCPLEKSKGFKPGKSLDDVMTAVRMASLHPEPRQEVKVATFKIKSNSIRNNAVLFGDLHVCFDKDGFANIPNHERHTVEREMIHRPGRYSFVQAPTPEPVPTVEVEVPYFVGEEPVPENVVEFEIEVGQDPKDTKPKKAKGASKKV